MDARRLQRMRRVEWATSIVIVGVVLAILAVAVLPRTSSSTVPKVRVTKPVTAE